MVQVMEPKIALLELSLHDAPDEITIDLSQRSIAQVAVQVAPNPLHIRKTFQRPLEFKIPNQAALIVVRPQGGTPFQPCRRCAMPMQRRH